MAFNGLQNRVRDSLTGYCWRGVSCRHRQDGAAGRDACGVGKEAPAGRNDWRGCAILGISLSHFWFGLEPGRKTEPFPSAC